MIRLFGKKKRVVFFPVAWANSVVRWITGIISPSGTIKIKNELDPGDNGSIQLDVNVDAVTDAVVRKMDGREFSANDRVRIRDIIWAYLDGYSVQFKDKRISVNVDWLAEQVRSLIDEIGTGSPQSPTNPKQFTSGYNGNNGTSQLTDTHTFGAQGATVQLACRSTDDGADGAVFFRTFTIASDGRIYAIGTEGSVAQIVTHA